jgi:hypothetical protein
MVAQIQGTFVGAEVDFGGSQGSDHALIWTIASTPVPLHHATADRTDRFDTDIDDEAWEEWERVLRFGLPPLTTLPDATAVDMFIDGLYHAFNEVCKATMKRVGAAPGFNSRWWNDECWAAAQAMWEGFWNEEEQRIANIHLKKVVKAAKQEWANEYITTANVWEVAAWRHGRRTLHILALQDGNGRLVYDHEGMASLLSTRFFAEEGTPIPTSFPDDPPAKEPCPFAPFGKAELHSLLRTTTNKSVPGSSGIGWGLLKRGWEAAKDHLLLTYNSCLCLGHHPARWKEAKVVAIPKLDKPNYSLPKAHRPISPAASPLTTTISWCWL